MRDHDGQKLTYGQQVRVLRYPTGTMYHRATYLGPGHTFRTASDMLESSKPIPSFRVRYDDGHVEDVDPSRLESARPKT